MKRMSIGLFCVLLCSGTYGQNPLIKGAVQGGLARPVTKVGTNPRLFSTAVLNRQLPTGSLKRNTVSYTMQKKSATALRPYLFNKGWKAPAQQEHSYRDVGAGIRTEGNLTEMSNSQFVKATEIYQQAMDKVQALSERVDTKIYYLGTPEAETLSPVEISEVLKEITQAQNLVKQAQVIWGNIPVMRQAVVYLRHLHDFYMMLSTGSYIPLADDTLTPVVRSDGHVYEASEFGLYSEGIPPQIPNWTLWDPTTWFDINTRNALPEKQRVAVLQDDEEVLDGLRAMKEKAELTGWQIDVYDDPEAFLNNVPYQQYDLILTDVLMKNGGGRYLARQLRSNGFEGTILTLSGFDVTHGGEVFFNDGIDGMIPVNIHPSKYPGHFWARLNNYFILKDQYGWKH